MEQETDFSWVSVELEVNLDICDLVSTYCSTSNMSIFHNSYCGKRHFNCFNVIYLNTLQGNVRRPNLSINWNVYFTYFWWLLVLMSGICFPCIPTCVFIHGEKWGQTSLTRAFLGSEDIQSSFIYIFVSTFIAPWWSLMFRMAQKPLESLSHQK